MAFNNALFVKSAFSKTDHLHDYPQILFIGKSNVGKSSLINALTNQKGLAYVSKTPGQTKLVNYYLIDKSFYLVDAPGFGYRKLSVSDDKFDEMMNDYLSSNQELKLIIYLLDSRREISEEDISTINYLNDLGYNFELIFTKCDKLNQSEKAKCINSAKKLGSQNYTFSSIKDSKMINNIKQLIISYLK